MEIFSRPKLGVALWTLGHMPLAESAPLVAEMQFDGMVLPFGRIGTAASAAQLLQENQLTCFAVSPNPVDLAHPNTAVRQLATDHVQEVSETAVTLQAPLVTPRNLPGRIRSVSSHEAEREYLETAVAHLATVAAQHNIRLAVEVVNRYESFLCLTTAETLAMLTRLNQPNLGLGGAKSRH